MASMASQILLNIAMGMVWELLFPAWTLSAFLVGYAIGAIILTFVYFRDRKNFYLYRIYKACILLLIFFKEILLSGINVFRYAFMPLSRLHPGVVKMDVDFENEMELVLISNMITLTPGTMALEISPDNKTIYIHALDCSDPEALIAHIRQTFESRIKEVAEFGN